MARFERGRSIKTAEPVITVDAGLPIGTYRFRLTVFDESGNRSKPTETEVVIQRTIVTSPTEPVIVTPIPTRPGGITPTLTATATEPMTSRGTAATEDLAATSVTAEKEAVSRKVTRTAITAGTKSLVQTAGKKAGTGAKATSVKKTATNTRGNKGAAKKGAAKKGAAKKGAAKKGGAKKGGAKKGAAKNSTVKIGTAKKSTVKKSKRPK